MLGGHEVRFYCKMALADHVVLQMLSIWLDNVRWMLMVTQMQLVNEIF